MVLQVLSVEPWCAPLVETHTLSLEVALDLGRAALLGRWWEGPSLVLFVDGTHDGPHCRMGVFSAQVGVQSAIARRLRAQSQ